MSGDPPPPGGAAPEVPPARPLGSLVLAAVAGLIAAWGLLTLFEDLRRVLLLAFIAALIASVLEYPVAWLSRAMPRALAAALVLVTLVGGAVLALWLSLPLLSEQGTTLFRKLPEAAESAMGGIERFLLRTPVIDEADGVDLGPPLRQALVGQLSTIAQGLVSFAFGTLTAVTGALVLVIVAVFLAYDPALYTRGLLRLVPIPHEAAMRGYLDRISDTVRSWMLGTLVAMTAVGAVTGLGLLLLGVDAWFLLAVLAFFGEFVPYAGPILASVPALLLALGESPTLALYVLALYLAVQQLEGTLLTPLVMRRAVDLPPALLIVWQLALASAFGFLALFAATPLLACIQATVAYFYVERTLGRPAAR